MSRLQAQRLCSYDEFTDLMFKLMKAAWGDGWGTFCEEFPNGTDPERTSPPIITYALKSKKPGQVGHGTYEIKPRYRQDFVTSDTEEGHVQAVSVYGQIFDCTIVFELWHESNAKVTQLMKQFEDFMRTYTGYMMQQGVGQILFVEMQSEGQAKIQDNLVGRHYKYLVRLEEQTVVYQDVIKEVIGRVQATDQLDENLDDSKKPYTDF